MPCWHPIRREHAVGNGSRRDARGVACTTFKLEGVALSVRDRWSTDSWRVIDDISEAFEEQRRYDFGGLAALEDTLDRLRQRLSRSRA